MAFSQSSSRLLHPLPSQLPKSRTQGGRKCACFPYTAFKYRAAAASDRDEISEHVKKRGWKEPRLPRRLITISTSDARFHGQWSCDYALTLGELQLADLAEEGQRDADVFVSLNVQKHAGFGFSVDGRIVTSFNRKCSCCFLSYCKEVDTTFDVWVLPTSRGNGFELPEIGTSDPSVIYVKPGSEADLSSLIQETIRLTASAKDTCSDSCEKSAPIWQYTDGKTSYDPRWSRLLEIRNAM